MSFVNISAVRTADPGNIWVPKNSFRPSDPFAVVLDVQVDSSVVQEGLVFDATFQINNPRNDPYTTSWFTILSTGDAVDMTSVVWAWNSVSFQWGTNFAVWWWFNHYSDAVSQISGGEKLQGIFYAEGTVNIQARISSPHHHNSGTKFVRKELYRFPTSRSVGTVPEAGRWAIHNPHSP